MSEKGKDGIPHENSDLPDWSEFENVEEPKVDTEALLEAQSHSAGASSSQSAHDSHANSDFNNDDIFAGVNEPVQEALPDEVKLPESKKTEPAISETLFSNDSIGSTEQNAEKLDFQSTEPIQHIDPAQAPENFNETVDSFQSNSNLEPLTFNEAEVSIESAHSQPATNSLDSFESKTIEPPSPGSASSLTEPLPASSADLIPSPSIQKSEKVSTPLHNLKNFSESQRPGKLAVPAAYPFSLKIEGHLEPHTRENLLDLIESENLGIRAVDLEPGLESGRLLLPRISEYAAVIIAGKLRDSSAKIQFYRSDAAVENTSDTPDTHFRALHSADTTTPEHLPTTTQNTLEGFKNLEVIDTLVSHAHFEKEVDTADIEILLREMKYKAHRKGARGLIQLNVSITPGLSGSFSRVLITAVAVK